MKIVTYIVEREFTNSMGDIISYEKDEEYNSFFEAVEALEFAKDTMEDNDVVSLQAIIKHEDGLTEYQHIISFGVISVNEDTFKKEYL